MASGAPQQPIGVALVKRYDAGLPVLTDVLPHVLDDPADPLRP